MLWRFLQITNLMAVFTAQPIRAADELFRPKAIAALQHNLGVLGCDAGTAVRRDIEGFKHSAGSERESRGREILSCVQF